MSKGSNPSQSTTTSSSVDPATAAYIAEFRKRALGASAPQPGDPALQQTFRDRISYGLDGDPLGGLDQFLNPYTKDVVNATNADFDRQGAEAMNAAGADATRAGAFNGGRAGVLQANALDNVNRNRSATLAGLRSGGYQQAVQQLLQSKMNSAQLGMQGLFGMNSQALQRLQAMIPGFTPTSQSGTTDTVQHTYSDPFSQLLGLGIGFAGIPGIGGLFNRGGNQNGTPPIYAYGT